MKTLIVALAILVLSACGEITDERNLLMDEKIADSRELLKDTKESVNVSASKVWEGVQMESVRSRLPSAPCIDAQKLKKLTKRAEIEMKKICSSLLLKSGGGEGEYLECVLYVDAYITRLILNEHTMF